MREQDRFEEQLTAALQAHTAAAPVEFDAAAFVHGLALRELHGGSRRPRLVPRVRIPSIRPVHVLALASLLLLALAGALVSGGGTRGLLGVIDGTEPTAGPLGACPAGSRPREPGPLEQARPAPDGLPAAVTFDPVTHRVVTVVTGRDGIGQTWLFDVCANTWSRVASGEAPGSPAAMTYDSRAGLVIAVDSWTGVPWTFDPLTEAWSAGTAPGDLALTTRRHVRLAYDAVDDLVILAWDGTPDETDVWAWNRRAGTWAPLGATRAERSGPMVYDERSRRLLIMVGDELRLLDPATGSWSTSASQSPGYHYGWMIPGFDYAYDPAGGRMLIYEQGLISAYDPAADSWTALRPETRYSGPYERFTASVTWDSVNQQLLVFGGSYGLESADQLRPWVMADDMLAFDPQTRTWRTLLAPTGETPFR